MARSRQDVPSQGNSRNRPSAQKIMGLFFPFLFHNLFPEALFVFNSLRLYVGSAAQLWFSLIFLFPFPHKREGKRLPQKQRVLDSFQLSARGKCPPGKFSDGETICSTLTHIYIQINLIQRQSVGSTISDLEFYLWHLVIKEQGSERLGKCSCSFDY